MSRFETCHAITAKWEGGWSDHPADPGGKTMYGVTEAVYHAWLKKHGKAIKPVRNITMGEALEIYRAQYWEPTAGRYKLVPGVDLATYDAGVNAGVSRAIKWLVQGASKGNDHVATVKGICRARLSFKQGLAIWKTFGKGWTNRVVDVEAKGVAMALAFMAEAKPVEDQKPIVRDELEREAAEAKDVATKQTGGAAGAGGTAGAGTVVDAGQADQLAGWVLAGGLGLLVLVAGYLVWRAYINRKRAAAFEAQAEAI